MYEQDLWSTLYIILIFVAFISGLALRATARSPYQRINAYEPWHARLASPEGTPRHDEKERGIIISKTSSGWVSGVLLSAVALAAIAVVAIFFWPGWPDNNLILQISATLRDIRADQKQTTSAIEAINDRPAAEKFLAQTRGTKATNDSLAAEDQFMALSARLSTLQEANTQILRDNAGLAEQLRTIQTQMAQDNVLIAERLKALTQTQMAARPGVVAMGSEERERRPVTTGSTATTPAATRSQTAHQKNRSRLRPDGSSGAARASPALTARSPSPQLPPSTW
jgi:hypothetical protein